MPAALPARQLAKLIGVGWYNGRPCRHHPLNNGQRYVSSGECVACANGKVAAYRATPRGRRNVLANARRRKYGITPEQFDALLAQQNGLCAVCGASEAGGRDGTWHLDHDHATRKVRGILCHSCNIGIGNFNDNPTRLRKAADYLERSSLDETDRLE